VLQIKASEDQREQTPIPILNSCCIDFVIPFGFLYFRVMYLRSFRKLHKLDSEWRIRIYASARVSYLQSFWQLSNKFGMADYDEMCHENFTSILIGNVQFIHLCCAHIEVNVVKTAHLTKRNFTTERRSYQGLLTFISNVKGEYWIKYLVS